MDGLWSGIKSKLSELTAGISSMATTVTNAAKSAFQVNSPSKRFIEIGKSLTEGLEVGWEKNIDGVNKAINDSMNYKGTIDVDSNLNASQSVVTHAKLLSDSDIDKLAAAMSVNVNVDTNLDGKVIGQSTYDYTVGKISDQERALSMATGGGY